MKQFFFTMALMCACVFTAYAQPAEVYIHNETECDIEVMSITYACAGTCNPTCTFINNLAPNGIGYGCTPQPCPMGNSTRVYSQAGADGFWEDPSCPLPCDYVPVAIEFENGNGTSIVGEFLCTGYPQAVSGVATGTGFVGSTCWGITVEFKRIPQMSGLDIYVLHVHY